MTEEQWLLKSTLDAATVRLEGVWKIYEMVATRVEALCDVNLSIEPGQYVAIMGHSGSGKSTILNLLGCLDRPTRGRYWLGGQDVSQLPIVQTSIAGKPVETSFETGWTNISALPAANADNTPPGANCSGSPCVNPWTPAHFLADNSV